MKILGGNKMTKEENSAKIEELNVQMEEMKKQAEEKDAKIEEQKNQLLRLMADFDNFKKRTASEREEIICFSNEALILALLPMLDNFDRAMAHIEQTTGKSFDDETIKGFALIKRQLEDVLARTGLVKIETVGKPFDPNFHEAILTKESKEFLEGQIIEEMQKGYKLKDKVIRPSMVIVSKKGGQKDE